MRVLRINFKDFNKFVYSSIDSHIAKSCVKKVG